MPENFSNSSASWLRATSASFSTCCFVSLRAFPRRPLPPTASPLLRSPASTVPRPRRRPRVMTLDSPKLLPLPRPVRWPRENGVRGHAMNSQIEVARAGDIARLIRSIRDERFILDNDLAAVYGVPTKRLNEQYRRDVERFPEDFAFRLTEDEWAALRLQIATLARIFHEVSPTGRRSAGFQPAVSRISNPQIRPSRYSLPTGSRRYGRLETCATQLRQPSTALRL